MNRKSIYAHITAVAILVSLMEPPAMAAGPDRAMPRVGPIQRSIQAQKWTVEPHRSAIRKQSQLRMATGPRRASRKMVYGVIGLVAGIYGGGLIGRLSDNGPDDMGALFGASVGAIAGPILGVWAASK